MRGPVAFVPKCATVQPNTRRCRAGDDRQALDRHQILGDMAMSATLVLPTRRGVPAAFLFACLATALFAPPALAVSKTARDAARSGRVADGTGQAAAKAPAAFSLAQHGPLFGHLPPVAENVQLISKLNLIDPGTGLPVVPGQIADVAVHKGFAYLNSWDNADCRGGGTFVVDIRDPSNPQQISFIPAQQPFYHGEGAQVITVNTPQFKGDLLAVNDETYGSNVTSACSTPLDKTRGGFDLYDVTNPANPVALVQGAGDRSPDGSLVQDPTIAANSFHSVFIWQNGPRAFLVASDNTELADVDIFDITDPRDPEFISDFDPLTLPNASQIVGQSAHGNTLFHHDVVVKNIGGTMRALVSYWDAGYVQLNVDDPAHPTYITDTNFDDPDPLTGIDPPEGNAHQAEYSGDNQFFLAADEDFAPFRAVSTITEAPFAGVAFESLVADAEPIPGGTSVTGDTVYVGQACTLASVPPPPPGVTIAVAERGVCTFQEKADAIEAAGYEMGVIFNNEVGGDGGRCEGLINMLLDPAVTNIPMAFVGRADGLRILNVFDPATYQCTGGAVATPGDTLPPPIGTAGLTIDIGTIFDGWGYAHLYDANTSEEIDAHAITESLDDRYALDFGALSIHEFATDPTTNLAYVAYYAGGMRVMRFSRANGLEETGRFIDGGGNDFWGVEQFTDSAGNRLIANSDRDFGLYITKYTGPGAVLAQPAAAAAPGAGVGAVAAPGANAGAGKAAPSSFIKFGTIKRLTIRNRRATATITLPGAGRVVANLRAAIGRRSVRIARTTRTATKKGSLRLTFRLSSASERSLRRTLARRPTHRTGGVMQVAFKPNGGTERTRNKSLAIALRS